MAQLFKYKGYLGTAEIDLDSKILCGKVLYIRSSLIYEANTIRELESSFKRVVDGYLEGCKADGIEPDKPFSGSFNIRISPLTHRKLSQIAMHNDHSLNEEVNTALDLYVNNFIDD